MRNFKNYKTLNGFLHNIILKGKDNIFHIVRDLPKIHASQAFH